MLDDQERLIASYPDVPDYRDAQGRNLFDYGKLLFERGEFRQSGDADREGRESIFQAD